MAPTARASNGQRLHLVVELITQTRLSAYGVGADIEIGVGEPVVMRPGAEKLTD